MDVTVSARAGNVLCLSSTGLRNVSRHLQTGFLTDARLAFPREVDTSEVTHMATPVHGMPAVSAYSASRASRGHMSD